MKKLYFSLLSFLFLLIYGASAQSFSYVDIYSGGGSSYPSGMTVFNGKVYFAAEADTLHGTELWSSDGTAAGTSLVADISPGRGSSSPENFTLVGNQLFFTAYDGVHGQELWVTDGTTTGTVMVADIWPGLGSSSPFYMTPMGGKLYFVASDSVHGNELWVSDGTTAGTSMLKDINPGISSSAIYAVGPSVAGGSDYSFFMTELNGKLYFEANDGVHGEELWTTDGTTGGTDIVADMWPGPGNGFPYCITALNGKLYMGGRDSLHGQELWVSDGTAGGTSMLKDIYPGTSSGLPGNHSAINVINGKLYFDATTANEGDEFWVSDGTTAGTTLVADIWPGAGSSVPGQYGITVYNNKMYMNAYDSLHGNQLWTSDGTGAGTTLVKVLSNYTPYRAIPISYINYNGMLVFKASTDSVNLEQVFISDGTASGTHILSPAVAPNTNPVGFSPSFCILNNDLFMAANFNTIGDELWIYGFPTGITPVSGEQTISAYPNPFNTSVTVSGFDGSGHYTLQVANITGREFYNTTIENPSPNTSVSMPDLAAGVYLMRISGQGSSQTFKLVKN